MPPKVQKSTASKAAKLAKLEMARKKAKQWAENQKKLKSKKEKKSTYSTNTMRANNESTQTREPDEVKYVSKKYSEKNKRKRAVESTDDDDSSTGPNGTPKVRKPIRKKVNKMTSPNFEYTKVKAKVSTSHSYSKRVYDSLESDEEMIPIEKTTPKQSSSKLGKKEKLRIAREKAAKWAQNQKSPEANTTHKSSRSSIDNTSALSEASNMAKRKSKSKKIINPNIEMEIEDRSSISRPKRSRSSKDDRNIDGIMHSKLQSQNISFTANTDQPSFSGSTSIYGDRVPSSVQPSMSTSTQRPVLIEPSMSEPAHAPEPARVPEPESESELESESESESKSEPEPVPKSTPASLTQHFETKPKIIPSPFTRIEPTESYDGHCNKQQYETNLPIGLSKTNKISPTISDSFVNAKESARISMPTSNHNWKSTMPSINDERNQTSADALEVSNMREEIIPSYFSSKNAYPIRYRNDNMHSHISNKEGEDTKFELEKEYQSNSQPTHFGNKDYDLKKTKQPINEEQNEFHSVMKSAIIENTVASSYNDEVMKSVAACERTSKKRIFDQKREDDVISTSRKANEDSDIASLFFRVKNTVFHVCNIIVAIVFFFLCVALVYHLIDWSKLYWGQILTKNKYNNMTRAAITSTSNVSIASEPALVPAEPEISSPPMCFKSTIDVPEDDNIEVPPNLLTLGITSCRSDVETLPCPHGGICFGGYLQTCVPADILEVSTKHDACELTERGNDVLERIKEKLIQLTLEQTCGCLITSTSTQNTSSCLLHEVRITNLEEDYEKTLDAHLSIMFDTESFCEAINIPYYVLSAMTSYWENNDVVLKQNPKATSRDSSIGLSSSFLQSKLPIPMSCYLKILLTSVLSFFFSTIYTITSTFFSYFYHFLKIYPFSTIGFIFACVMCLGIRNQRRKNHGLRQKTSEIREMAYKKLKSRGAKKYGEKHLRDDIAHELYPDSLKLRKKFMAEIWPRVLVEVRCDSRVRRGLSGGMEWWEWADRGAQ